MYWISKRPVSSGGYDFAEELFGAEVAIVNADGDADGWSELVGVLGDAALNDECHGGVVGGRWV